MNFAPQSEQTKEKLERDKQERFSRADRVSQGLNRPLCNQVIIEGFIVEREAERFTASGVPVIKLRLKHENGTTDTRRRVICDVSVLCVGHELCKRARAAPLESLVRVEGFLTRNAYKKELSWVILEVSSLEILELQGFDSTD